MANRATPLTREGVPVHLVKGDDERLVRDAVAQVLAELVGDEDPTMVVEDLGLGGDGDDETIATVVGHCQTPPFLTARRVVVLRDVGQFRTEQVEPIISYLADPLPTTALVLAAGKGQTPVRLVNAVKKHGHVIDATPPSKARERESWMVARMKDAPVKLDAAAGRMVIDHLGEDVGRVTSLLAGLAAAYGDGAAIGTDELAPFLGEAGGVAPWDLTDAIDRGEVEAALVLLHRMLGGGDRHPLVVMATLHRHFAAMLKLDGAAVRGESEAAALLGAAPYTAKKALTQARKLGSAAIGDAIVLLAQADLDLRGDSEWPNEVVLEVLVARLCRLSRAGAARATRPAGRR